MDRYHISRRDFLKLGGMSAIAIQTLGFAGIGSLFPSTKNKSKKPNIVLVFTDDQGWADTSVRMMKDRPDSRSEIYKTPNLERLAKDGMIFSSGYSPSPVCSPSRDSILWGKTPTRLQHSILLGKANARPEDITTPRAIKAGDPSYVTAHFGKWACSPKVPEDAGFDISDGRTDNWHGDWRHVNGLKTELSKDDPKRIFSVTNRACEFMENQTRAGTPFYMRVSHYAVHVGHKALSETVEKYKAAGLNDSNAVYAGMIENLDTGLGKLLDKIDQLGIADNTYVIFTSDNGGGANKNGPLKGGKASLWEGGIRVPMVARGPIIPAGTYCNIPVVGWDLLPTFAELAGNTESLPDDLDGGSLVDVFIKADRGKVKRAREALIFHYPWYDSLPMSTIRLGDFKLVMDLNTNETQLYNLAEDIGETTDLSKSMPEKANMMRIQLSEYLQEVDAEKIGVLRAGRKNSLNDRIRHDRDEIKFLQSKIEKAGNEKEKQDIQRKILMLKKKIQGDLAALERVEKSMEMKAWR